jgi:hypothetical protein
LDNDAPMLLAWARFRSTLTGLPGTGSGARRVAIANQESGLWRLLATNNRELGRSFLLYHRFDAARTHVAELQAQHDTLAIEHVPGPIKGSRGWVILAVGAPVMTCSRWYSSLSAGSEAASRAMDAFASASLAASPDSSDASGRFRRRGPLGLDVRP